MKTKATLNVFLLSSLPLSREMQVETGATFASAITVGQTFLFKRVYDNIREAVGDQTAVCLHILHPQSAVDDNSFDPFLFYSVLSSEKNVILKFHARPEEPRNFASTFAYIASQSRGDGPILLMAGDVLLSSSSELLRPVNLSRPFCFLALSPESSGKSKSLPFKNMLEHSDRWTVIYPDTSSKDSTYFRVRDRQATVPAENRLVYLYSGCCSFGDSKSLKAFVAKTKAFKSKSSSGTKSIPDQTFFEALINYYPQPAADRGMLVDRDGFFDFGHVDTYWISKLHHFSARNFNKLQIEASKGYLVKTSNSKTFEDQSRWFQFVDGRPTLRDYLPKTSFYGTKQLKLEIIPSPSLSDLLFQNQPLYTWVTAAERVTHLLENLYSESIQKVSPAIKNILKQACRDMYLTKTKERLAKFNEDPLGRALLEKVDGLGVLSAKIEKYVKSSGLLSLPCSPCIIHGDLCFSNILYDYRTTSIKIIDPRGSFGEELSMGAYGDPAYDLAKLYHSFDGYYDLIVFGALQVRESDLIEDNLELDPPLDSLSPQVLDAYDSLQVFKSTLEAGIVNSIKTRKLPSSIMQRAKLIQPLLFLSMLPLHSESSSRQKALFVRGIELLRENGVNF